MPDFSKVRGTLIVSRDPNGTEKLLGKANEVQHKNLFTWYIYYFAAQQNGQVGHVKVTYDNSNKVGVLGHVDDVTFHKPGSTIPIGKFNSIRSPK